jgi:hypothetical protein
MRRINNLRILLGRLEDQRFELEARLIELINDGDEESLTRIRTKLNENQDLRLDYLNELLSLQ